MMLTTTTTATARLGWGLSSTKRGGPQLAAPTPASSSSRLVCRFRDATKADQEVDAPSWRRHFFESDPPDESTGPTAIIQRAKDAMRESPVKLADLALPSLGALGSVAFSDSHDWPAVGVGIAAGAVARLLQQATLEQKVPFTLRKHTLLLPVFAELLLGQFSFAQVLQQPQYRGKALPADHPDSKLVQKIAERIIEAVEEGHGSGFQKHISKFEWEVVVINDETVNAFVLPGGKIVVFAGLIKLFNRNEDMLATVIGHECAHALARHTSEKLTLGLFVALSVQLLLYTAQRSLSRGGGGAAGDPRAGNYPYGNYPGYGDPRQDPRMYRQQQVDPRLYRQGDPRADPRFRQDPRYGGRAPGYGPYGPYARDPYSTSRRGNNIYYVVPEAFQGESAAPRLPPGYRGGPPGPYGGGGGGRPGGSPVGGLINIATNLLLQLPFSRRAEAEADLIGLKLMAIAGYNPDLAPKTFAKMEEYQARMMGKAAANASYIQDHPRSASRVKLLQEELDLMKQFGAKGREVVLTKVPYWML